MTKTDMILVDLEKVLMHAFNLVDILEDEEGMDYVADIQWKVTDAVMTTRELRND